MVELFPKDIATDKGLIISVAGGESKESRADKGTVVKVGPGKLTGDGSLIPINLKPGDRVKVSNYGGLEVRISGKDYYVFKGYEILAKF